MIGQFLMA